MSSEYAENPESSWVGVKEDSVPWHEKFAEQTLEAKNNCGS